MLRSFFPLLGMLLLAQPLQAQDDERSQADYEDKPGFGGPESVTEQLKHADELRETMYDWPVFDGYLDWKKQIKEDYDVSFGLHFYGLYQKASDSLPGRDDDAMGNVFRFLGNWTVFEKDNGNLGRIEWRVESRSDWFGLQAPGSLGGATGTTALVPGFGYSDNFDMDLAVINWTQGFASGKAGYAVGRLAFDAYLDAFPFQTFSRGFINRSFILNPTLPTTGIGALGGVVQGFVTDNIWLGGQMHDANAASGRFDFDTVQEGEWLKSVEVGYTPSFGPTGTRTSARWRMFRVVAAGPSARPGNSTIPTSHSFDSGIPTVVAASRPKMRSAPASRSPGRGVKSGRLALAGRNHRKRPSARGSIMRKFWRCPTNSRSRRIFRCCPTRR
jgi:hypothetical protein